MTDSQKILLAAAAFIFLTNVVMGLRYRSYGGDTARLGTIMLASAPLIAALLVWLALSGTVA